MEMIPFLKMPRILDFLMAFLSVYMDFIPGNYVFRIYTRLDLGFCSLIGPGHISPFLLSVLVFGLIRNIFGMLLSPASIDTLFVLNHSFVRSVVVFII